MKLYIQSLFIMLAFISCKQNNSEETEQEEVEFIEETGDDYSYENIYDSLIEYSRNEWIPSKFEENQFDPNSNYCFAYDNILLYSDTACKTKKGRMNLGDKVEIKRFIRSTEKANTFTGNIVEVEQESGELAYVYDGYLLPIPYPDKGTWGFVDYGLSKLHLLDSVHFEGSYYGNKDEVMEENSSESIYPFENGITISSSEYYEGGSTYIELTMLSMKEGLILMDALSLDSDLIGLINDELVEGDYEIDTDDSDEYGEGSIHIQYKNDELEFIEYFIGEGCGDWYIIQKTKTGIKMEMGGGC